MESAIDHFHDLFARRVLPNRGKEVRRFPAARARLPASARPSDATFRTPAPAAFARDALEQDPDRVERVDQLDEALRSRAGAH
ncbi:MAG: DUF2789 family protein [Rhodocyclaceae bacterium]|nr:DUF2789 family protein [Rhodocyclaceae bacterium]